MILNGTLNVVGRDDRPVEVIFINVTPGAAKGGEAYNNVQQDSFKEKDHMLAAVEPQQYFDWNLLKLSRFRCVGIFVQGLVSKHEPDRR